MKYVNRHEAAEPERSYSEHYLYELYLASSLYHSILNANAVEVSSRMSAMENATKNKGEIYINKNLKDFKLQVLNPSDSQDCQVNIHVKDEL